MAEKIKSTGKLYSNIQNQLMNDKISDLQGELVDSPTAFSSADPTKKDIYAQIQLSTEQKARQKLLNDSLKEKWYGPDTSSEQMVPEPKKGPVEKVLEALQKPLLAQVGAVKYLTGKGSESDIFAEMKRNITEDKEAYGDLLRRYNLPSAVATPAGLALDIILDPINLPINLLTGGTGGIALRTGRGLVKGGLEGAKLGAKSRILEVGAKMSKLIPGLKQVDKNLLKFIKEAGKNGIDFESQVFKDGFAKIVKDFEYKNFKDGGFAKVTQESAKQFEGTSELVKKTKNLVSYTKQAVFDLRQKAADTNLAFDTLTNNTVEEMLMKKSHRLPVATWMRKTLGESDFGRKLLDLVDNNQADWAAVAKGQDTINRLAKKVGATTDESKEAFLREIALKRGPEGVYAFFSKQIAKIANNADNPTRVATKFDTMEDVEDLMRQGGDFLDNNYAWARAEDSEEVISRLLNEGVQEDRWKDVQMAINKMAGDSHEGRFNWVNKVLDWNADKQVKWGDKNIKAAENTLNAYDRYIKLFKAAKINPILSPASWTNAVIGNTIMNAMSGIDIASGTSRQAFKDALGFIFKKESGLNTTGFFLNDRNVQEVMMKYPTFFRKTLGIDPWDIKSGEKFNKIAKKALNEWETTYQAQYGKILSEAEKTKLNDDIAKEYSLYNSPEVKKYMAERSKPYLQKYISNGALADVDEVGTGFVANEILDEHWLNWRRGIQEKAANGEIHAKLLNKVLETSESYDQIDRTFKIAGFLKYYKYGVTRKELEILGRNLKIAPTDLLAKEKGGQYMVDGALHYRIMPEKALEIANETYMNYAALPSLVKIMRSLPIIGAPFISFSYLMAAKLGKSLVANPAAFNKINFALHELGGQKTPLEKEALKSEYSSYLDKMGMMRMGMLSGVMGDNPIYLNATSLIPYQSLNMFNPSERVYGGSIPDSIISATDRLGLGTNPVGEILKNYFIFPMLLRDDAQVLNQWGGPIYPSDADAAQKIGYATRDFMEALMPSGVGSGVGTAMTMAGVPDYVIEYLPTYQGRSAAMALQGRTPVGIYGTEPALQRSLRNYLGLTGVKLQPLNTSFVTTEAKKELKNK